jgi:hypothetical protein
MPNSACTSGSHRLLAICSSHLPLFYFLNASNKFCSPIQGVVLKPLLYARAVRIQCLKHKVKPLWLWATCKAACRGLLPRVGSLLAHGGDPWFPVLDGPQRPPDPPHLTLSQNQWLNFTFKVRLTIQWSTTHSILLLLLTLLHDWLYPISWLGYEGGEPLLPTFWLGLYFSFYCIYSTLIFLLLPYFTYLIFLLLQYSTLYFFFYVFFFYLTPLT